MRHSIFPPIESTCVIVVISLSVIGSIVVRLCFTTVRNVRLLLLTIWMLRLIVCRIMLLLLLLHCLTVAIMTIIIATIGSIGS